MERTVELLDRQVAFLLKQPDDTSFLVQVEPFLRAADGSPGLRRTWTTFVRSWSPLSRYWRRLTRSSFRSS
jgi:hypothetical protein